VTEEHDILPMAQKVAGYLRRKVGWIEWDDLVGYAAVGIVIAANEYIEGGMDRGKFMRCRAANRAMDLMRQDRVIDRSTTQHCNPVTASLDAEFSGGDAYTTIFGEDSPDYAAVDDADMVETILSDLSQRDRLIVCYHYGLGLSLSVIAEILGCTESAVGQRERRALTKLRDRYFKSIQHRPSERIEHEH
jgi:RNA polymerase sigma factor (sigma-70 family)